MRSQTELIFGFGGLFVLLLMALTSLVLLHMAYYRMSEIIKCLSRSPAIMIREKSLGLDPVSRFFMISLVGSLLLFSRNSLRNGDLDLQDYQSFPAGLKRLIKFVCGLMLVLTLMIIVIGIVGKYMGWLK